MKCSGSAGPGGKDALALQHWCLKYGQTSFVLRKAIASLTSWLANGFPPWAAYRGFQVGRLVALNKFPGIRPVAIDDVFYRLFAKTVVHVCGDEAKEACGIDQLCGGLEAGIEGCIHAMRTIWGLNCELPDWGFFLLDAENAFNNGSRVVMIWNVRHE